MRSKLWVLPIVVLVSYVGLPATATSETYQIKAGEPAPTDGILFDPEAARQAAEDLSRLPLIQAQLETIKAQLAAKEAEAVALQAVGDLRTQQLELKQQEIDMLKRLADRMEKALDMSERAANTAIKAAEQSNEALAKMQGKVDAANKRGFWFSLLSGIAGLFLGRFGF